MKKEIKKENVKLAVVRVRGVTGIKYDINSTIEKLGLSRKNHCVVVPKNESYFGMVKKAGDYVTWGEINEEMYSALIEKRGEEFSGRTSDKKGKISYNKFIDVDAKKIKKVFRLNSPKKGYGRKGVKFSFADGGALGYRGDKINDLLKRMI